MTATAKQFDTITKCGQFIEFFEREIRNGMYKPGSKVPSERELARAHQLSHLTVNKALSALVSKGMLRKIQGSGTYVTDYPEPISNRTVGAVIETSVDQHFPFAALLPSFLQDRGYFVTPFDIFKHDSLVINLKRFLSEKPAALMVHGNSKFPFDVLDSLPEETQLIFIQDFEGPEELPASYVLSDFSAGGYDVAKHLLKLGRRKILIDTFEAKPAWTSGRYAAGVRKALEETGLEPFGHVDFTQMEESDWKKLFGALHVPDAIVSIGDYRLRLCLPFLKKQGLRVPEDVALIGYFNTPWAETCGFTSVCIRQEDIVRTAWECLDSGEDRTVMIEPRIVFRDSCP